jgi:beta-fructofuranosidase
VPLPAGPVEVELSMDADAHTSVSLLDEVSIALRLEVDPVRRLVRVRRTPFEASRRHWATEGPLPAGGRVDVRMVVDGSVVEVYVAGGPVFTERVYPSASGSWSLDVEGPSRSGRIKVHRLRPMLDG